MLIVSWNVAGWRTTVKQIDQHYQPPPPSPANVSSGNKKKRKLHPAASLQHFFARHNADVYCLQEHKFQKQQLSNRQEPCQASHIPGYESFWACCTDDNYRGLNGVVTYAKAGSVQAADAAPLQSPDLDCQGRCLMTDHGSFCVFNVYAPNAGGHPLTMKMKFHRALRQAMQRQRERNKRVILVGDLNISHKAKDMYWKDRYVHLNDVLQQAQEEDAAEPTASGKERNSLAAWKREVVRHWGTIEQVMATKEVAETQTSNSQTNETYNKFRLSVKMPDGRQIFLGNHEHQSEYCLYGYDFSADTYVDPDTDERVPCRESNLIRLSVLSELMTKIVGLNHWGEETFLREIANTFASAPRVSPSRTWLSQLESEDGMCDSFRHFYPTAEGRFTCWHQFTNKRYTNEGARIDYCMVDASLKPLLRQGSGLRCCRAAPTPMDKDGDQGNEKKEHGDSNEDEADYALGEEAALRAATANGCFQPAPFKGGGMETASQRTLDTQFGEPTTGMIYTPPTFSDHIAVSVLFDDTGENGSNLFATSLTLGNDAPTRKSQPHKAQKTIAAFFGSAANKNGAATSQSKTSGGTKKRSSSMGSSKQGNKSVKRSSIKYHFQKKCPN